MFRAVVTLLVGSLLTLVGGNFANANSVKVYRYISSNNGTNVNNCLQLNNITLNEDGYLHLHFSSVCQKTYLHNATTSPPSGIRGVKGLESKVVTSNQTFTILVTPETKYISFTLDDRTQKTIDAYLTISRYVDMLQKIASAGDWMSNFNASESQLAEEKASDNAPPSIQILSPTPSGGQISRVDTYTTFIRGKVTDDAGVMNILVAGKKVGIKEDGTFAAKVKLKIGRNEILVKAEDVNNNVSEALVLLSEMSSSPTRRWLMSTFLPRPI